VKWLKQMGKVLAYPVTKPVDLLAKRAGAKAVEGALERVEQEPMMRSVKTTVAGVGAILALVVAFLNGEPITLSQVATVLTGLGLLVAKDYNVSGR
jgi:uncharacterized protein YacL